MRLEKEGKMYKKYKEAARIGRFTWDVMSPLFGKYYIDIQTAFGSRNTSDVPESFDTKESAEKFLFELGFKAV